MIATSDKSGAGVLFSGGLERGHGGRGGHDSGGPKVENATLLKIYPGWSAPSVSLSQERGFWFVLDPKAEEEEE